MSPVTHGLVLGLILIGGSLAATAWSIWWERKLAARMQGRVGPMVVGWSGLLQPIADGAKLMLKEDLAPANADKLLFHLAPPLVFFFSLLGLAVVPLASGLVVADLDVGMLFALAAASLMVLPVWMAGWASNNKYALLGAMRAAAQSVSYGVPLFLSALVPVVLAGSMRLTDIVDAQAGYRWFALWPPGPGLAAAVIFLLSSLAEANRIPFDIPEAESELVAGISTEYAGMKFGMFYLAEYLHTIVAAALMTTFFLGGWEGPGPAVAPLMAFWFLFKCFAIVTLILWIRWTYLRLRSDQLLKLCWHWLVPLSLAVLLLSALFTAWRPA